jgi:hypothetical protein
MKNYKIFIVFAISIILVLLSFLFRQYFFFFPIICIVPFSCGINRRSEREQQNQTTQFSQPHEFKKICPFCEKELIEENLRFCPNCGIKL